MTKFSVQSTPLTDSVKSFGCVRATLGFFRVLVLAYSVFLVISSSLEQNLLEPSNLNIFPYNTYKMTLLLFSKL